MDLNYITTKKGGIHGISILVSKTTKCNIVEIENTDSTCVLWLYLEQFSLILGAIYIPPNNSKYYNDDLFDEIIDDISYIMSIYDVPFLLMGDFNSRTGQLNDILDEIDLNLLPINDMYIDDIETIYLAIV